MHVEPVEDEFAGAFWRGAREHRLLIDRCQDCGWWIHHPSPFCPRCRTRHVEPEPVCGRGTIVSHAITHRPPVPTDVADLPVLHVLVELEEQAGLRVASTLVGIDRPVIGAPVEVVFDDRDGYTLPRFRMTT